MVGKKRILLAMAVVGLAGLAEQPLRPAVVMGQSMAPTYANGEVLLTAPVNRPLRRGDVVIADGPDGPVMKRVALIGGDRRVQFFARSEWVDMATMRDPFKVSARRLMRAVPVPKGMVYLLGDNLDTSIDSRQFGLVPISKVRRIVVDSRSPDPRTRLAGAITQHWIARGKNGHDWTL